MTRLRRRFDDELLVRNGLAYDLTPFPQSLVTLVDEAMLHIQRARRAGFGFDPAASEREFVIAASDYAAALIVRPLREILREEAPACPWTLSPPARPVSWASGPTTRKSTRLVGLTGYSMQGASKQLFRDSFVAVADAGNALLLQPRLTLEDLAVVPHAGGYFGEASVLRRTSSSSPGVCSDGWPPWWPSSCHCRPWWSERI